MSTHGTTEHGTRNLADGPMPAARLQSHYIPMLLSLHPAAPYTAQQTKFDAVHDIALRVASSSIVSVFARGPKTVVPSLMRRRERKRKTERATTARTKTPGPLNPLVPPNPPRTLTRGPIQVKPDVERAQGEVRAGRRVHPPRRQACEGADDLYVGQKIRERGWVGTERQWSISSARPGGGTRRVQSTDHGAGKEWEVDEGVRVRGTCAAGAREDGSETGIRTDVVAVGVLGELGLVECIESRQSHGHGHRMREHLGEGLPVSALVLTVRSNSGWPGRRCELNIVIA